MVGVSIATVCHYRQRWDIPSFRSTLAPGATPIRSRVSARPVVVLAPSSRQQGFSVSVKTETGIEQHITIAADIVIAAQQATTAAAGQVVEIVHLGPALVG